MAILWQGEPVTLYHHIQHLKTRNITSSVPPTCSKRQWYSCCDLRVYWLADVGYYMNPPIDAGRAQWVMNRRNDTRCYEIKLGIMSNEEMQDFIVVSTVINYYYWSPSAWWASFFCARMRKMTGHWSNCFHCEFAPYWCQYESSGAPLYHFIFDLMQSFYKKNNGPLVATFWLQCVSNAHWKQVETVLC